MLKNLIRKLFVNANIVFFVLLSFTFNPVNLLPDSHSYNKVSALDALKKLKEGNERFVSGKSIKAKLDLTKLKDMSDVHEPFAVVIGCSDSRAPIEMIFDHGLGDLFILGTAGQVSGHAAWGSIEYAVELLGVNLVVVMGHTKCGAVTAACHLPEVPGHIVTLINAIKPAVEASSHLEGDIVDNAVKMNVALEVKSLKRLEPVLTKKLKSGKIKIVGAVYDIQTGKVEFLDDDYLMKEKFNN